MDFFFFFLLNFMSSAEDPFVFRDWENRWKK